MKPKILFVVNVDWFFLSHRLPVALAAKRAGYDVHVAVGLTDRKAELQAHGFQVHPLAIKRGRANLVKELIAFLQLIWVFQQIKPGIVHLVTIKPVLFGGIAARIMRVPAIVAAISGLGFTAVASGMRAVIERTIISYAYRIALGGAKTAVIVQNLDDQAYLTQKVGIRSDIFHLIHGSGVDLDQYHPTPLPSGTPMALMACRLISHKGVYEFCEAARILQERGVTVRFCLAGGIDPENPTSLTSHEMDAIKNEGIVEVLGQRKDMAQLFAKAHMVVLPSYYGEGVPKVLIEAAASGRAIITTDMPGCRDTLENGVSGTLIPPRNAVALAKAIETLAKDPDRCRSFGDEARTIAEKKFDIRRTVQEHLRIYAALRA